MDAEPVVMVFSNASDRRRTIESAVGSLAGIHLAEAWTCDRESADRIRHRRPALVVLDAGDGEDDPLALLATIQSANTDGEPPIHAVLVSRFTPPVMAVLPDALEHGHFDHILLPQDAKDLAEDEIGRRIATVVARRLGRNPARRDELAENTDRGGRARRIRPVEAVFIGCSTGGPQALLHILPPLCAAVETPIFVAQHIRPDFSGPLAASLDQKCRHRVIEGVDGIAVQPRHVYVAPGGQHLLVRRGPDGPRVALGDTPPENGSRPSADVLFRSAAEIYGPAALGVILSGMGKDGVAGALALEQAGAAVLAQDEASSVVWGMPGSAVAAGTVDLVVPLDEMADVLLRRIRRAEK